MSYTPTHGPFEGKPGTRTSQLASGHGKEQAFSLHAATESTAVSIAAWKAPAWKGDFEYLARPCRHRAGAIVTSAWLSHQGHGDLIPKNTEAFSDAFSNRLILLLLSPANHVGLKLWMTWIGRHGWTYHRALGPILRPGLKICCNHSWLLTYTMTH